MGDVEINNPNLYYRQGTKEVGEDFAKSGVVKAGTENHMPKEQTGRILLRKQTFERPMFSQGHLWYGVNGERYPSLLVGNPESPMSLATKRANPVEGLRYDVGSRRVPVGEMNTNNTTAYRWQPGYGYRKQQTTPQRSMTWGKAQTIAHDNYTGSPHQLIGTIQGTQPNSPVIGNFYKKGSEQMVYTHPTNPNLVTKIYADKDFSDGFSSVEAIKNFHKSFMKRNQVPIQERVNYQGYLQNENGSLFPVYTQTKVNEFDSKMPWQVYEQQIEPRVDYTMGQHGFKKTKDGNYTNGKITVTDVSPENIGYTNNGDIRFFDTYVYKLGGRVSHQ